MLITEECPAVREIVLRPAIRRAQATAILSAALAKLVECGDTPWAALLRKLLPAADADTRAGIWRVSRAAYDSVATGNFPDPSDFTYFGSVTTASVATGYSAEDIAQAADGGETLSNHYWFKDLQKLWDGPPVPADPDTATEAYAAWQAAKPSADVLHLAAEYARVYLEADRLRELLNTFKAEARLAEGVFASDTQSLVTSLAPEGARDAARAVWDWYSVRSGNYHCPLGRLLGSIL